MTPIKLSELERLSKEATNGEWRSDKNPMREDGKFLRSYNGEHMYHPISHCQLDPNNCDYIAAANPLTISRLCEAIRIAHGALDQVGRGRGEDTSSTRDYIVVKEALTKINDLVDLN